MERISLSWEIDHPERRVWTDTLVTCVSDYLIVFQRATDITRFSSNFSILRQADQIKTICELFVGMAKHESSFNPLSESVDVGNKADRNSWSVGLFQMSGNDSSAKQFKARYNDLKDALVNIQVATFQMMKQVDKEGLFILPNKNKNRYWAVLLDGNKYSKVSEIINHVKTQMLVIPKIENDLTPWLTWFKIRNGWTEFNHTEELSKGWIYTNVPNYKTVIGSTYAWCAMSMNTALETNGYKGTKDAGAISFKNYGMPCEPKIGSIIVLQHSSGRHHVTTFVGWYDEKKTIMLGHGGNQSDAINVSKFNVSGNALGCDQIIACRWPATK